MNNAQRASARDAVTFQSDLQLNSSIGTVSIGVDRQPPEAVRPNDPLTPVVVNLRLFEPLQERERLPGDDGALWAHVSLVSAEGQLAMARLVPDILAIENLTTPVQFRPSPVTNEAHSRLIFRNMSIRQSGWFKIHISVIKTPTRGDDQGDGDPMVAAPQEVLGVDTRLIRVHAFAPVGERIGKQAGELSSLLNSFWLVFIIEMSCFR